MDLDGVIGEVARVLRPEGRAIFVVGDCRLRGQFIENSKLVRFLMEEPQTTLGFNSSKGFAS